MCTSAPGGADVFFYKYHRYPLWRGCKRMHADATLLCLYPMVRKLVWGAITSARQPRFRCLGMRLVLKSRGILFSVPVRLSFARLC